MSNFSSVMNGLRRNTESDISLMMPFFHTQSRSVMEGWYSFSDNDCNRWIVRKPQIVCEVFPDDNPVYLFYGKAAYKPVVYVSNVNSTDDTSIGDVGMIYDPPIADPLFVLALDAEKCRANPSFSIIRVFPFDTGAAYRRLYSSYISVDYMNFEMDSLSDVDFHIRHFFGTNDNYYGLPNSNFIGRPIISVCEENVAVEYKEFVHLINAPDNENFDDRRSVIEVQAEEITCLSDALIAVFMPKNTKSKTPDGRVIAGHLNKDLVHRKKYCC